MIPVIMNSQITRLFVTYAWRMYKIVQSTAVIVIDELVNLIIIANG